MSNCQNSPVLLEVDDLFVGVEHLFQDILSFLYLGHHVNSPLNEEILNSLSAKLDLRPYEESKASKSCLVAPSPLAPPPFRKEVREEDDDDDDLSDACKMDVSICCKCDLLFISKEEFMAHRMIDCTRKFTCKTCGSMFTRVQALLEHLVRAL